MTPEQREKLKQAVMKVAPDDLGTSIQYRQFAAWATPAAILSLIAQVEALTVPQGAITPMDKESLDEKALNALLWFYRRAENAYGRLPFAEEAITGLRARIARCTPQPDDGELACSSCGLTMGQSRSLAAPTIPAIPGTKENS